MEFLQYLPLCDLGERVRLAFYDPSAVTAETIQNVHYNLENPQSALEFRLISQMLLSIQPFTMLSVRTIITYTKYADEDSFRQIPISNHGIPHDYQRAVLLAVLYVQKALLEATPAEAYNSYEKAIETAHSSIAARRLLPYLHYNYAEYCLSQQFFKLALRNYKLAARNSSPRSKVHIMANNGYHRICEVAYRVYVERVNAKRGDFRRRRATAMYDEKLAGDPYLEYRLNARLTEIRKNRETGEQPRYRSVVCGFRHRIDTGNARVMPAQEQLYRAKTQPPRVLYPRAKSENKTGVFYQRKVATKCYMSPSIQYNTSLTDFAKDLNVPCPPEQRINDFLSQSPTFCLNARLNEYDDTFHHSKCDRLPVPRMLYVPDDMSVIGHRSFALPEGWKRAVEAKSPVQPVAGTEAFWGGK